MWDFLQGLLENEIYLTINLIVLNAIAWVGGSYGIACGLIKFRKGWIVQNKMELFKANLYLLPGTLLLILFFKMLIWK